MSDEAKNKARLTHDRLLRLSAVLEELVKSEVAGGHSRGILMWDPPATEGRRLYSSWCGPDPPDHFNFHSDWPPAPPSVSGYGRSDFVVRIESPSDVRSS